MSVRRSVPQPNPEFARDEDFLEGRERSASPEPTSPTSPIDGAIDPEAEFGCSTPIRQNTSGSLSSRFPPKIKQESTVRQGTVVTNASSQFEDTESWDRKTVLSLDGGGVRGYSSLLILQRLMQRIGELEREHEHPATTSYHPLKAIPSNDALSSMASNGGLPTSYSTISSQYLPCHYFDYMAGTSTGGLISIMLGRLRMNIDDCIKEYEMLGDRIFGHTRWFHLRSPLWYPRDKYSHETMRNVIEAVVNRRVPKVAGFPGGKNFAYDESRCRIIVVAIQKRIKDVAEVPYLFRTYKHLPKGQDDRERGQERNPGPAHDIPIAQVARATSAAPGYFEKIKIDEFEFLDGGFGANNPSREAFQEVRQMNNYSETAIGIFISVGTGKDDTISRFGGGGLSKYVTFLNFAKKWASDSERTHNDMVNDTLRKSHITYHRLNVDKGIGKMKLDEWKRRHGLVTGLGRSIGRMRRMLSAKPQRSEKAGTPNSVDSSTDSGRSSLSTHVPRWGQDRNKTLEKLRRETNEYLSKDDVKRSLDECAQYLVKHRRSRVHSRPERWERSCFNVWYRCTETGCPRAEKEYPTRDRLQKHLRDKHPNEYVAADERRLDEATNRGKIVEH
ncbi:MAG: hypothetical protein M1833_005284 [Piccolia ochrophora]|nr:MAG: hypothetical protein M1833_005284 [Piccolia ochrophora]